MNEENKPTVVIDTNLFISAIIGKNNTSPFILVNAWRNHHFQLFISEPLIKEVENVLTREKIYKKYAISKKEIEKFITELHFSTTVIFPIDSNSLPVRSRDKKDNKLLACALAGDCDYLITGDEDLLILNGSAELGKLQIVKAAEFLKRKT